MERTTGTQRIVANNSMHCSLNIGMKALLALVVYSGYLVQLYTLTTSLRPSVIRFVEGRSGDKRRMALLADYVLRSGIVLVSCGCTFRDVLFISVLRVRWSCIEFLRLRGCWSKSWHWQPSILSQLTQALDFHPFQEVILVVVGSIHLTTISQLKEICWKTRTKTSNQTNSQSTSGK